MTTAQDPQGYIDDMARRRGYVLDYHTVMAEQDFEVLQAAAGFEAWREVVGVEGLEPTVETFQGGSGA